MKLLRWIPMVAGAALFAACTQPTAPRLDDEISAVDPVVVMFSATQGLPGGPIGERNGPPFMGGLPFAGAPASATDGRGPGAAFPDNLKLTDAQKAQIAALVAAFTAANAADLAAMKAAHEAARAAHMAGKSREDIKAILDKAKAAVDRVRAAAQALHTAIANVLSAEQRAWLDAHKPEGMPRTP